MENIQRSANDEHFKCIFSEILSAESVVLEIHIYERHYTDFARCSHNKKNKIDKMTLAARVEIWQLKIVHHFRNTLGQLVMPGAVEREMISITDM